MATAPAPRSRPGPVIPVTRSGGDGPIERANRVWKTEKTGRFDMNRFLKAGLLTAAALALTAGSCTPRVQRDLDALAANGVFVIYDLTKRCGSIDHGPNGNGGRLFRTGPFLVYEIRAIHNQGSGARAFEFEPDQVRLVADHLSRHYRTGLESGPAVPVVVAGGTEWTSGGVLTMSMTDFGLGDTSLRYERSPSDPPVVMLPRSRSSLRLDSCQRSDLGSLPNL